jgi:hypothetical protein
MKRYTRDDAKRYRALKLKMRQGEQLSYEEFLEYVSNPFSQYLTMVAEYGLPFLEKYWGLSGRRAGSSRGRGCG